MIRPIPTSAPDLADLRLVARTLRIRTRHWRRVARDRRRPASRTVRSEDTVGRLGGDEFACLLDGLQCRMQLGHLACKVFDAVAAPCKIGMQQLRVRPSIGIAMCPEDGPDADALLRNADAAMYNAKRQQSGYSFFDEAARGWSLDSR